MNNDIENLLSLVFSNEQVRIYNDISTDKRDDDGTTRIIIGCAVKRNILNDKLLTKIQYKYPHFYDAIAIIYQMCEKNLKYSGESILFSLFDSIRNSLDDKVYDLEFKPSPANTVESFYRIRQQLRQYGISRFKNDLLKKGIFKIGKTNIEINSGGPDSIPPGPFNPFAKIVRGELPSPYGNLLLEKYKSTGNNKFKEHDKFYFIAKNKPELDNAWNDPSNKNASMSMYHKFLLLKSSLLSWNHFNVLTFGMDNNLEEDLKLLRSIRECATLFACADGWSNIGMYLHCYPHNTVQSFHLHMINLNHTGHTFNDMKYKNLPIDDAISVLEYETTI